MPTSSSPWQDPATVQQFLRNVRGAVPLAIEQIEIMLQVVAAAREQVRSFLDLGCGDAVLAAAILEEHPHARGVLLESSEGMLDAARHRLREDVSRLDFVLADVEQPGGLEKVSALGPFDAIVSAFALHGIEERRKREIFAACAQVLLPGGIFISIEHVASATRWSQSPADDLLIDAIFGEAMTRSPGKTRAEVAQEYYAQASRVGQAAAPLEVQCDWLRQAGFDNVDCFLKVQELAVFGGQRVGGTGISDQ